MQRKSVISILIFMLLFICGCAGLEVAMENKDVSVVSALNDIPFFDSSPGDKVYIKVQNFSEYPELSNLTPLVQSKYQQRGFEIVSNPQDAKWIVQAKIVNIKKEDISARQVKGGRSSSSFAGGAAVGGAAGVMSGGDMRSGLAGALIGGALAGAADLTVNSWVKLGYLTIVTDIQVKEKKEQAVTVETVGEQQTGNVKEKVTSSTQTNWVKYRFQAVSRAKKVNLDWDDCKNVMTKEITRILSSLL